MLRKAWYENKEDTISKLYDKMVEAKAELADAERFGNETEIIRAADKYEFARVNWRMVVEERRFVG